tara:strand:+ start:199 stop:384 length:186 start_codon:yes stop_codon:yes gene_type:complete
MQVGDLVKCALDIYGIGIVIKTGVKVGYRQRIKVQWLNPPEWLLTSGGNIASHFPSNLEAI